MSVTVDGACCHPTRKSGIGKKRPQPTVLNRGERDDERDDERDGEQRPSTHGAFLSSKFYLYPGTVR